MLIEAQLKSARNYRMSEEEITNVNTVIITSPKIRLEWQIEYQNFCSV